MQTFLEPFSQIEENECLNKIRNNDLQAKEDLILRNMRLVAHVAKKYIGSEEDTEELISIGTIGLIKAVSSFKMNYGSKFSTYAIRCIENEILMYFRTKRKYRYEISLYEPIGVDKEGNQIQLVDVIENDEQDVSENVQKRTFIKQICQNIKSILSKREYEIICKRYGLNGYREHTQKEIANALGISRSYVSRIEKKSLQKLKSIL